MRYDGKRKTQRNKQLIYYRDKNPGLSLREIGEIFNISSVRVWQILKRYNKNTNGSQCANCIQFQEFQHCSCREPIDVQPPSTCSDYKVIL